MAFALPIDRSIDSFARELRAENKSPNTIRVYVRTLARFAKWAATQDLKNVTDISRVHLSEYLNELHDRDLSPSTVSQRQSILRSWATWLEDSEFVDRSPAAKLRRVTVPEQPVAVPSTADVQALLKTCKGRGFENRRDNAILRVLATTGLRRSECGSLRLEDVNLDKGTVRVTGKGRRRREVNLDADTLRALDRYLIARDGHAHRDSKALWLGRRGPLSKDSIYDVVRYRAKQAGVIVYPHQLRHYWTDRMVAAGMPDSLIVHQAGWSNHAMLHRYGRSNRGTRAKEALERLDVFADL